MMISSLVACRSMGRWVCGNARFASLRVSGGGPIARSRNPSAIVRARGETALGRIASAKCHVALRRVLIWTPAATRIFRAALRQGHTRATTTFHLNALGFTRVTFRSGQEAIRAAQLVGVGLFFPESATTDARLGLV